MTQGFFGTFSAPLDEKNRAVLPARLRESLSSERLREGFMITQGFEGCLVMFPRDVWRELTDKIDKLPFTEPRARLFKRFFLTPALEVPIDRVGRVTLADFHRKAASIDREVVFNGMGDHLELWAPAVWKEYRTENAGRYEEVAASLLESAAAERREREAGRPGAEGDREGP